MFRTLCMLACLCNLAHWSAAWGWQTGHSAGVGASSRLWRRTGCIIRGAEMKWQASQHHGHQNKHDFACLTTSDKQQMLLTSHDFLFLRLPMCFVLSLLFQIWLFGQIIRDGTVIDIYDASASRKCDRFLPLSLWALGTSSREHFQCDRSHVLPCLVYLWF